MMNRDPKKISFLLIFLSEMLDRHEDEHSEGYQEIKTVLGIETKRETNPKIFYLSNCEELEGLSLLQYIDGQAVQPLRQRQELIDLAIKIAKLNHDGDEDKAMEEVMENFSNAGVDVLHNIISFYVLKGKHDFVYQCLKGIKNPVVKGDHKSSTYFGWNSKQFFISSQCDDEYVPEQDQHNDKVSLEHVGR